MPVDRFLCRHIAIFRPRKKTFHLLQQSDHGWLPYPMQIHPNDYRLRRSFHQEETATLALRKKELEVLCKGYYLETFDESLPKYIPVCMKTPRQTYPPSLLAHPIPYPTTTYVEMNPQVLWTLKP